MVRISLPDVLAIVIMLNLINYCRGVAPGKDLEPGRQHPVAQNDWAFMVSHRSYHYEPVIHFNRYLRILPGEETNNEGAKG